MFFKYQGIEKEEKTEKLFPLQMIFYVPTDILPDTFFPTLYLSRIYLSSFYPKFCIYSISVSVLCLVAHFCPNLCNSMDCSLQAPLSIGFSRQEYQSGLPFPSPGYLPDPEIKTGSLELQVDSSPAELQGKPNIYINIFLNIFFIQQCTFQIPEIVHEDIGSFHYETG